MVWLPVKFSNCALRGGKKTPNHPKKKKKESKPYPCPLIFKYICIFRENSIHMFLNLSYAEPFPREYLTCKTLRTFPHLPLPVSSTPSTPETGIHISAKVNLGGNRKPILWEGQMALDC